MNTGMDKHTRPDQYKVSGPAIDGLKMWGSYELTVRRAGKIIEKRQGKNLITDVGEGLAAARMDTNDTSPAPDHIAFGSGAATALKADTQLQTEIAGTRTLVSSTVLTGNAVQLVFQHTATAPFTLFEMGIFNAITSGTMASRFLVQKLTMVISDIIDITWTLTFTGVD